MRILYTALFIVVSAFMVNAQEMVSGIIIAKVKPEQKVQFEEEGLRHPQIQDLSFSEKLIDLKREYPNAKSPKGQRARNGRPFIDLSRTFRIETTLDLELSTAIIALKQTGLFEYVEPTTYSESHYDPNDPWAASQLHLAQHQVLAAWDSTLGDTNVVIGITDTGIDVLHEDLSGNIKRNYADPIDGIDNDNDSYTDNFEGWDFFDDDNNLYSGGDIHGSSVCFISSATPDNNLGGAGNGFNCKFIPVKVSNNIGSNPNIVTADGLQGIGYAVEKGANIVNCSWGTTTWSQAGQDMIDYATVNFDAVVVASAGNIEGNTAYYPASFANVISVTGVDTEGLFENGVNDPFTHHDSIDIAALGRSVLSSASYGGPGINPIYFGSNGTSLAAPQVSGVAGLIRSKFPCLDAFEVMDLLVESSDVYDTIPAHLPYAGKIGKRLNALAAMQANLCTTVSVDERIDQDLKIYPNPANDRLYWNGVSMNSNTILKVFNLLGETVIDIQVSDPLGFVDVSMLNPGIYEVVFIAEQRTSHKLVVDR